MDEASLGFRIAGRILENHLKLGNRVEAGEVLARLEPQNEMNALRSAKANLAAAQGELTRARNHFQCQEFLLARDVVSRATFDDAKQQLQTTRSQVDATEAQLKTAHDLVSFTELNAQESVFTMAGVGISVADYGLERCCFSRVISSGDQPRISVTSIHASM
jgi:multidrug efflux pump subunit AcrA (membrane-fusion protein)